MAIQRPRGQDHANSNVYANSGAGWCLFPSEHSDYARQPSARHSPLAEFWPGVHPSLDCITQLLIEGSPYSPGESIGIERDLVQPLGEDPIIKFPETHRYDLFARAHANVGKRCGMNDGV
jgi:hypothetical protein